MAQDAAGRIWVVWSAQVARNFDLYARAFDGRRWSPAERLTTRRRTPTSITRWPPIRAGNLYLAWQSARSGNFDIYLRVYDGRAWSRGDPGFRRSGKRLGARAGRRARMARVTVLWDTYAQGQLRRRGAAPTATGSLGPLVQIANSGAMESRASAQYDRQGRLWVAWDQGDWNWGKDYGYQIPESGRGLLSSRRLRVGVLENGRLQETTAPIADAVPEEFRQTFLQPVLVLDGAGNPWVFFRIRTNTAAGHKGATARSARCGAWKRPRFANGRWSPMMEFPQGYGRIDSPVAAIAQPRRQPGRGVGHRWRVWPAGRPGQQDLRFTTIPVGRRRRQTGAGGIHAVRREPASLASPTRRPTWRASARYRATARRQHLAHRARRYSSPYRSFLGRQSRRLARRFLSLRARRGGLRLPGRVRSPGGRIHPVQLVAHSEGGRSVYHRRIASRPSTPTSAA